MAGKRMKIYFTFNDILSKAHQLKIYIVPRIKGGCLAQLPTKNISLIKHPNELWVYRKHQDICHNIAIMELFICQLSYLLIFPVRHHNCRVKSIDYDLLPALPGIVKNYQKLK